MSKDDFNERLVKKTRKISEEEKRQYFCDQELNDKYVFKKSAEYLLRHLSLYNKVDRECLEIFCWLLGPGVLRVASDFHALVSRHKKSIFHDNLYEEIKDDMAKAGSDPDDIASVFHDIFKSISSTNAGKFRRVLFSELRKIIKDNKDIQESPIEKIIGQLCSMFSLTDLEYDACIFLFILSTYEKVETYFVNHLELNRFSGRKYLLNILELTPGEFKLIFSGTIKKIGLLEMDQSDLRIESDFLELILSPDGSFANKFYKPLGCGTTLLDHYFVDPDDVSHIINLFRKKDDSSAHILLYGKPGTGKTSFAKAIAGQLDLKAYQVTQGEEDNASATRRAGIIACLNMTNNGNGSLIVVDEADNLLNTSFSWFMRGETLDKGWLNNLLEKPGTRMIWITNSIDAIDESVMRRFSFSIHFKPFSRKQRIILWENLIRKQQVRRFFSATDISDLAKRYQVTAGVVDMALRKAREIGVKGKSNFIASVTRTIDSYETLKNNGVKIRRPVTTEKVFSLEGLNVKACLPDIVAQLGHFDEYLRKGNHETSYSMNLLFYGPPGTGKSELARNISYQLDRKLLVKGLSDILDPYVGMTERNIRNAFDEAEAEEAVLVIDEVDSFLYSRDKAVHSWESSQTNEFLTCMERYRGVLICTTNMLEGLDSASLRRFNHKVGFDFLTPDGAVAFYEKFFGKLVRGGLDQQNEKKLRAIGKLAPGDFKVVRDRCAFRSTGDLKHDLLIKELAGEARIKGMSQSSAIGF